MRFYVQTDDPRKPYEVVEVAEDRAAWANVGVLAGLGALFAGLIYVFI